MSVALGRIAAAIASASGTEVAADVDGLSLDPVQLGHDLLLGGREPLGERLERGGQIRVLVCASSAAQ